MLWCFARLDLTTTTSLRNRFRVKILHDNFKKLFGLKRWSLWQYAKRLISVQKKDAIFTYLWYVVSPTHQWWTKLETHKFKSCIKDLSPMQGCCSIMWLIVAWRVGGSVAVSKFGNPKFTSYVRNIMTFSWIKNRWRAARTQGMDWRHARHVFI